LLSANTNDSADRHGFYNAEEPRSEQPEEFRPETAPTSTVCAFATRPAARLKARFSANGKLLDLENQDRSLWQGDLIALGKYYLEQSESNPISNFHIEACIAYTHCVASSFENTDWPLICQLYSKLLTGNANPFIELNYAIALYFSGTKEKAFDILSQLEKHPYLKNYFLLNATIGRFYVKESNLDLALHYLDKAIHQTNSALEKEFIGSIIDEITLKRRE